MNENNSSLNNNNNNTENAPQSQPRHPQMNTGAGQQRTQNPQRAQAPQGTPRVRPAGTSRTSPSGVAPSDPSAANRARPATAGNSRPAAAGQPRQTATNAENRRPASAGTAQQRTPASAQQRSGASPQSPDARRSGAPSASAQPQRGTRPTTARNGDSPQNRQPADHAQQNGKPTGNKPPVKQESTPAAGNPPADNKPVEKGKKKKTTLSKAGAEMMSSAVKALIYIVAVFVVAIFLSIIVIRVGNDIFALVKSDEVIDINIPEDADINDVADILHENGIISFPGLFSFYGGLKDDDGVFIAGDYSVSPSMSYDDLRAAFKPQPVTGTSWITIPEGYTVDEIIDLMVSYGIGDRETYIDVINNYEFDYWFVEQIPEDTDRYYRLEGYLFPDSYEFYNSSSEVTVINKLLARFDEVFVQDYRDKAEEMGMTVDEIITIASLIEKEAGTAADYRYVSSVFHNRLNNPSRFPKLESDATTVYAIQVENGGVRPEEVSADEIRNYDSPYNSYMNSGLIPGAIANPSASAIRYALYPTESNYYFFVAGPGGKTYFASTQAEHDANIAAIKQQIEQSQIED